MARKDKPESQKHRAEKAAGPNNPTADAKSVQPPAKKKVGRPSGYNIDLVTEICRRIASGELLYDICKEPGMPEPQTLYNWMIDHKEFFDLYMMSKRARAQWRVNKIDEIAEDVIAGRVEPFPARVAIDAHKWAAGKEDPNKFSDKVQAEISGKDGKDLIPQERPADRTFAVAHAVAFLLADAARQGQSVPLISSQQDQDAIEISEEST